MNHQYGVLHTNQYSVVPTSDSSGCEPRGSRPDATGVPSRPLITPPEKPRPFRLGGSLHSVAVGLSLRKCKQENPGPLSYAANAEKNQISHAAHMDHSLAPSSRPPTLAYPFPQSMKMRPRAAVRYQITSARAGA